MHTSSHHHIFCCHLAHKTEIRKSRVNITSVCVAKSPNIMTSFHSTFLRSLSLFAATCICLQNLKLSFDVGHRGLWRANERLQKEFERPRKTAFGSSIQEHPTKNVPVFYNLYVTNSSDAPRVKELVKEQFSFLRPEHSPIFLSSIGYQIDVPNTILLQHHEQGTEAVTLQALWQYCKSNKEDIVVYMHSKG